VIRLVLLLFICVLSTAQAPVEFSCPMDPEVRSKAPGLCPKCGMKLEPGILQPADYPLSLKVSPAQVPAERELELEFRVTDPKTEAPVTQFQVMHEKLFHLFIVASDLTYFAHEHPELDSGGVFRLKTMLPKAGIYRLLADYDPVAGTPQLTPKTITTAGYTKDLLSSFAKPPADLAPKQSENLEVELSTDPPQPIAGKKTLLFFKLKPMQGLQPYLGAWGHMLVASNDFIDMIHTHPSYGGEREQIQFNVFFPREAIYRIWVQFQREGKVNTVSFTIPVSQLR
jgi:hypothetical protein